MKNGKNLYPAFVLMFLLAAFFVAFGVSCSSPAPKSDLLPASPTPIFTSPSSILPTSAPVAVPVPESTLRARARINRGTQSQTAYIRALRAQQTQTSPIRVLQNEAPRSMSRVVPNQPKNLTITRTEDLDFLVLNWADKSDNENGFELKHSSFFSDQTDLRIDPEILFLDNVDTIILEGNTRSYTFTLNDNTKSSRAVQQDVVNWHVFSLLAFNDSGFSPISVEFFGTDASLKAEDLLNFDLLIPPRR